MLKKSIFTENKKMFMKKKKHNNVRLFILSLMSNIKKDKTILHLLFCFLSITTSTVPVLVRVAPVPCHNNGIIFFF